MVIQNTVAAGKKHDGQDDSSVPGMARQRPRHSCMSYGSRQILALYSMALLRVSSFPEPYAPAWDCVVVWRLPCADTAMLWMIPGSSV
jgi:hypothetical protein